MAARESPGAARLREQEGVRRNGTVVREIVDVAPTDLNVPVPMMTEGEARACVNAINRHMDTARTMLLDLYEREGWRALGYDSWRACVVAEFHRSQSYLYYQLQAARTEREISTIVETEGMPAVPSLPEWHLRQIAELPIENRREVALALARRELTSEQNRQLIAERTRANRAARPMLVYPLPELPASIDLRQADAAQLPWLEESVDLIVTSPPYSLAVEYDGATDDLPYPEYLRQVAAWSSEMYRVARPQGRLCLNVAIDSTRGGPRPLYSDWLHQLSDAGWIYRTTIVWADNDVGRHTARGSSTPAAVHVMTPVEVICVLHKGEWRVESSSGHDLEHEEWISWTHGLWTFPNNHSARTGHPCPFPLELPRRCIKLFSFRDAVICDPFVGSGTTAVAAGRLGRRMLGSDISGLYVGDACARVAREVPG